MGGVILEFEKGCKVNREISERIVNFSRELEKKGYDLYGSKKCIENVCLLNPVHFLVTSVDMTHFDRAFEKLTKKYGLVNILKKSTDNAYVFEMKVSEDYVDFSEEAYKNMNSETFGRYGL